MPKGMKRICSRCGKKMSSASRKTGGDAISRGICGDCWTQLWTDRLKSSQEIVEQLAAPVLLLDDTLRIKAANSRAQNILGRPLAAISNFLPGDAMECVNARQPGGCGQSLHCQACGLRRALETTLATGVGVEKSPAYQDVYQEDGSILRHFYYISTEKMEDFILLRIDEVRTLAARLAGHRPAADNSVS
jgi:PAS domain-containing protein